MNIASRLEHLKINVSLEIVRKCVSKFKNNYFYKNRVVKLLNPEDFDKLNEDNPIDRFIINNFCHEQFKLIKPTHQAILKTINTNLFREFLVNYSNTSGYVKRADIPLTNRNLTMSIISGTNNNPTNTLSPQQQTLRKIFYSKSTRFLYGLKNGVCKSLVSPLNLSCRFIYDSTKLMFQTVGYLFQVVHNRLRANKIDRFSRAKVVHQFKTTVLWNPLLTLNSFVALVRPITHYINEQVLLSKRTFTAGS